MEIYLILKLTTVQLNMFYLKAIQIVGMSHLMKNLLIEIT